jgi:TolB protein
VRLLTYSEHDTSPAVSPDGKTLAFTSDRAGQPCIWLKQFHGGDERALTSGPDDFPRFSPDGSSILFIRTVGSRTDLYWTTLLGSEPRKLIEDAIQADWSPDGQQIAFLRIVGQAGSRMESVLYTIPAAGGAEHEVARFPNDYLGQSRWSPDGRWIFLNTQRSLWGGSRRQMYAVDVKAGKALQVQPSNAIGSVSNAAWLSPDEFLYLQAESVGDTVSVSSARLFRQRLGDPVPHLVLWVGGMGSTLDRLPDGRLVFDNRSGRQNLREYDLTGRSRPRWITRGSISDRQPAFAPDGDWLMFSSNRSGNLDLFALSTRTGAMRAVVDDPAEEWDPAWTPDGRSILWSSNRSGNLEIWMANRDGTGVRQVTHDGVDAQNPTMTRDGQWIVYSTANPAHRGLWKIHPDGSGPQQLLANSSLRLPEVSPDGKLVVFAFEEGTAVLLKVARIDDGSLLPFEIRLHPQRKAMPNVGRARWTPDGAKIVFTGQDAQGLDGIYVQDFVPGADTTATRKALAGFTPEWVTESLGVSSDGTRLVVSEAEWANSIYIAEGLSGQPIR